MSAFEIQYVGPDQYTHAECVEAWDREAAVQDWRIAHHRERVHLLDVIRTGECEEVAA